MTYNEKGNLSGLLGTIATSSMRLPTGSETIPTAVRGIDLNIIGTTGEQKWNQVQVHSVDPERYGRERGGMELIQKETEAGANSVLIA